MLIDLATISTGLYKLIDASLHTSKLIKLARGGAISRINSLLALNLGIDPLFLDQIALK